MSNTAQNRITVVGGGLAGSECALQLAHHGIPVTLCEMRGNVMTPAHRSSQLAEIVCSNSFGSLSEISAPGQLKWEARKLNSFILKAAEIAQVPAGQALGIDREVFAQTITTWIETHPLIEVKRELISSLNELPRPCVIATGPLTHETLATSLQEHFGGDFLYFFDAIAPIISADSIDTSIAWKADRYDKGSPDYFNCPLNKEEYFNFINAIKEARKIEPKHFECTPYFESCMPIEAMVERGDQTPRFGPMKPVGLKDPKTGRTPFAVVQLRQDNKEGTAFNMVGFQTRMAYGDQKTVFKLIPGLQNAEFLKLGSIHRNLFINTPCLLNPDLSSKHDDSLFFAGQITGVEGYFESTCIGLMVAKNIISKCKDRPLVLPPRESALGSLLNAITDKTKIKHFQPTNINMALFPMPTEVYSDKSERKKAQIKKAQESFDSWASI